MTKQCSLFSLFPWFLYVSLGQFDYLGIFVFFLGCSYLIISTSASDCLEKLVLVTSVFKTA